MGLRLAGVEEKRKSLNQIDGFFSLDPFSRALSIFTGGASDVALVVALRSARHQVFSFDRSSFYVDISLQGSVGDWIVF